MNGRTIVEDIRVARDSVRDLLAYSEDILRESERVLQKQRRTDDTREAPCHSVPLLLARVVESEVERMLPRMGGRCASSQCRTGMC